MEFLVAFCGLFQAKVFLPSLHLRISEDCLKDLVLLILTHVEYQGSKLNWFYH